MFKLSENEKEKIVKMYVDSKISIRSIGRMLKIDRRRVSKALRTRRIEIKKKDDAMRIANTKHIKTVFKGNEQEKAYITGLVIGDIYPIKKSRYTLRLTTATTHNHFINLLREVFSKYGPVHIYPAKQNDNYRWNISIDLDLESFSFLLKRDSIKLPERDLLYSFLAGLIDSDGSIQIRKTGKNFQFIVRVFSQNRGLLKDLQEILSKMDFKNSLYINSKKGKVKKSKNLTIISNKDDYVLELYSKEDVINLLKVLPIKHPEKILWKEMILEIHNKNLKKHEEIKNILCDLRDKIGKSVEGCIEYSKEVYEANH